ncbi:VOC family protein [Fusibacter bizertensis]|uniref:VOC family protein n=1 Tax=Fusibacter bizertensis TaxID=1488331 RepID=A0ABT6NAI2_9FIRM|nr:VOC family protein [Fusibacter bizertensis]MDH8677427.1 VOC family protein [Fusibacter bizertensis]
MRIEHIALWTAQLEVMKDFYETYFGATSNAKYTNDKKQFASYFLTFESGARLELMESATTTPKSDDANIKRIGFIHIAISTGSEEAVTALTATLRAHGFTIHSEPRRTGDGYYESSVLDPDGNIVEITV